ncbi:MAG: hypothetical protein GY711_16415 [bacterium]|nr:hypothetical protein [bacterium]
MEIKRYTRSPRPQRTVRLLEKLAIRRGVLLRGMLAGAVVAAAFAAGVLLEKKGISEKAGKVLALDKLQTAANYVKSFAAKPEHLVIDIKHEHYEQLAQWRQTALRRNQITTDLKQYVPATVRHGERSVKVALRLKGDWVDHVSSDKWSFRVKVKGDDSLFGMKRFSIQHPRTRSYIYEWVYHQGLARAGVVALRYRFINVTINGRDHGVYAVEEHFARQLVEHNQRREGVIVRFNADFRYRPFDNDAGSRKVKVPGVLRTMVKSGIGSEFAADVTVYDEDKHASDPVLDDQLRLARGLMEAFRAGRLPAHEVFDIDRLAMYFAVSELFGAVWTADDWSDMRFLYDPVQSRIEPISVEGGYYEPLTDLLGAKHTSGASPAISFHAQIFADPVFFERYVAALEEVSERSYLDELVADIGDELQDQLRTLHTEWPHQRFSTDVFRRNASVMRAILSPNKGLHAYLVSDSGGTCTIELGAIQSMPLEVLGLSRGEVRFEPRERLVVRGKRPMGRVEFTTAIFDAPGGGAGTEADEAYTLHYRLLGTERERTAGVFPNPRIEESVLRADLLRMEPNHAEFDFLELDEQARTIEIVQGTWTVERDLILPPDYLVTAAAGAQLRLATGATILSYSPLRWTGTADEPIVISSEEVGGQGVVVMNAGSESVLRFVLFQGLSAPRQARWQLTGAVTFHESPLDMRFCRFSGNDAEDSLNVFRSDFTIRDTTFTRTPSDAIDSDFAVGSITDCTFRDVGGDAIDVSGSQVEVHGVEIVNVGDKGLSIGESSGLNASGVSIRGANVGVAVKDLSDAFIDGLEIADCEMGLAVFQKKPEYGPARLRVDEVSLRGVVTDHVVDMGCMLLYDKTAVEATHESAKSVLYAAEKESATSGPGN